MKLSFSTKKKVSFGLLLCLLFLVCEIAEARVGGGGGFRGGGRSGGGSGGGDGGGAIVYLILRLIIAYPYIGIPVAIGAIFLFYKFGEKGTSEYTGHVIRKGLAVQNQGKLAGELQKICQRDPGFDPKSFKSRVRKSFVKMQENWSSNSIDQIRPFVSDGTYERFSILGKMYETNRLRNVMVDIHVTGCGIVGVESSTHFDTIHVKITASAVDYFVDAETGKKISGSKVADSFVEYWSFLRRPGAKTLENSGLLEGFCPNCGNPLNIADKTKCGSCQAVISSGEYDWVLAEITQAESWVAPVSKPIKGLPELQAKDSAFNEQFIEDRVSTIFWAMRYSEFSGKAKVMDRFATKEFTGKLDVGIQADDTRLFFADPAVGSVEVVEVVPADTDEFDRIRVKIVWSGHQEKEKMSKRLVPNYSKSHCYSHEYVLMRHKDVVTPAGTSLLSMHCQNCGAPATEKTGSECEYCATSFVDGSKDWVLESMGGFKGYPVRQQMGSGSTANQTGAGDLPNLDAENVLSAVITVMLADDILDDKEGEALVQLANRLSYPVDGLPRLIEGVQTHGFQAQIPDNTREAQQFMMELIRMALADGNICRRELALIKEVATKVGYMDTDIDQLVKKVRKQLYADAKAALKNR